MAENSRPVLKGIEVEVAQAKSVEKLTTELEKLGYQVVKQSEEEILQGELSSSLADFSGQVAEYVATQTVDLGTETTIIQIAFTPIPHPSYPNIPMFSTMNYINQEGLLGNHDHTLDGVIFNAKDLIGKAKRGKFRKS